MYASGEASRVGDVVRRVRLPISGVRDIGDVVTTIERFVRHAARGSIFYVGRDGTKTWAPASHHALIARSGDPVTFQPGDVLEGVRDGLNGAIRMGEHYVLDNRSAPSPAFTDSLGLPRSAHPSAELVTPLLRLVHRPEAPITTYAGTDFAYASTPHWGFQAVRPVRTIADIARDLRPVRADDVKPGDTVLVRGVAIDLGGGSWGIPQDIRAEDIVAHDPAPLRVGDRVLTPEYEADENTSKQGVVRFIDDDGSVQVRMDYGVARTFAKCELSLA